MIPYIYVLENTKANPKGRRQYVIRTEAGIIQAYYRLRSIMLDRLARDVVRSKISGKEYHRRVSRLNKWCLYKIDKRKGDLVAHALAGTTDGN